MVDQLYRWWWVYRRRVAIRLQWIADNFHEPPKGW